MSNIIEFPAPHRLEKEPDDFVGGCPECGGYDTMLNVGRNHWFLCSTHKTKWWLGSNLFSSWREEDECVWVHNVERLKAFREVDPVYPAESHVTDHNTGPVAAYRDEEPFPW